MSYTNFRKIVWGYYRAHGRHNLPWRKTKNPYRVLVSEVMLQQTQVERVSPFYEAFVKRFPTIETLAHAPLADVLRLWQGLGYNRRAKLLQEAAVAIAKEHHGTFPRQVEELEELPGIGPYTARAVAAFAFDKDVVFVETNIRTAILHHFFPHRTSVSDAQVLHVLEKILPAGAGREWNLALMDYGASLKRIGVRINARSKHYVRQSKFLGSSREARGAVLKALSRGARPTRELVRLLGKDRAPQLQQALAALCAEGLVERRRETYRLPK